MNGKSSALYHPLNTRELPFNCKLKQTWVTVLKLCERDLCSVWPGEVEDEAVQNNA